MFELYALAGIPIVFGLSVIGKSLIISFYGIEFAPAVEVFYFLIPLIRAFTFCKKSKDGPITDKIHKI